MRRVDVAASLFVTSMWGVAFVALKKVLESGPPLTLAGVRFVLAGLLLLPLAARRRRVGQARSPTGREVLVVGLLHTTALYGLGNLGVQRATAGASALLLNTNPIMVAFLAVPLLGETLRPRAVAGALVALAGVAVISVRSGLGSPFGVFLLLTGAVAWAAASIAVKRCGAVDLIRLSCGQMIVGGLPLLALGLA